MRKAFHSITGWNRSSWVVGGSRGGPGPYPCKAHLTPEQELCSNEAVHCVGWGATPGLWSALIGYKTQIPSKTLRWKAVLLLKVGGLSWKCGVGRTLDYTGIGIPLSTLSPFFGLSEVTWSFVLSASGWYFCLSENTSIFQHRKWLLFSPWYQVYISKCFSILERWAWIGSHFTNGWVSCGTGANAKPISLWAHTELTNFIFLK